MKRLIINADDFGYDEAINYGIIKAYKEGIVSSTSMMANMPGFDHAIELYKKNNDIGIGVHLTLTCYKPLLKTHKNIVNKDGNFDRPNLEQYDLEEVYNELCAQVDKCLEAGLPIDHLDSHHHIHTLEYFKPVITKLIDKYKLPIRGGFEYTNNYKNVAILNDKFYAKDTTLEGLKNICESLENNIYDLMVHPAYVDAFLNNSSSYAINRINELEILTSKEAKQLIKDNDIELSTYKVFKL
ncbi:MAG: chitin disaccharide deacetylase [Erysipelotrichaceae bacterium]